MRVHSVRSCRTEASRDHTVCACVGRVSKTRRAEHTRVCLSTHANLAPTTSVATWCRLRTVWQTCAQRAQNLLGAFRVRCRADISATQGRLLDLWLARYRVRARWQCCLAVGCSCRLARRGRRSRRRRRRCLSAIRGCCVEVGSCSAACARVVTGHEWMLLFVRGVLIAGRWHVTAKVLVLSVEWASVDVASLSSRIAVTAAGCSSIVLRLA